MRSVTPCDGVVVMRTLRRSGVVTVTLLASVLALGACNSSTTKCSNGSCEVHLKGSQAATTIDGKSLRAGLPKIPVTLNSAKDGSASITVRGSAGTCKPGETLALGDYSVTCTDVKTDEVTFTLKLA